jgi:hypothetical protein
MLCSSKQVQKQVENSFPSSKTKLELYLICVADLQMYLSFTKCDIPYIYWFINWVPLFLFVTTVPCLGVWGFVWRHNTILAISVSNISYVLSTTYIDPVTKFLLFNVMINGNFLWFVSPDEPNLPHCWRFVITLTNTHAISSTFLEEWSARSVNLYPKTHDNYKRQTYILPAGFEPAIAASELPQTYALDRSVTGVCKKP